VAPARHASGPLKAGVTFTGEAPRADLAATNAVFALPYSALGNIRMELMKLT
jgi:hypothetical protein